MRKSARGRFVGQERPPMLPSVPTTFVVAADLAAVAERARAAAKREQLLKCRLWVLSPEGEVRGWTDEMPSSN